MKKYVLKKKRETATVSCEEREKGLQLANGHASPDTLPPLSLVLLLTTSLPPFFLLRTFFFIFSRYLYVGTKQYYVAMWFFNHIIQFCHFVTLHLMPNYLFSCIFLWFCCLRVYIYSSYYIPPRFLSILLAFCDIFFSIILFIILYCSICQLVPCGMKRILSTYSQENKRKLIEKIIHHLMIYNTKKKSYGKASFKLFKKIKRKFLT